MLPAILALCSNLDQRQILIKTSAYKDRGIFLRETVYGFLFYTQDVHNDQEEFNILCVLSQT